MWAGIDFPSYMQKVTVNLLFAPIFKNCSMKQFSDILSESRQAINQTKFEIHVLFYRWVIRHFWGISSMLTYYSSHSLSMEGTQVLKCYCEKGQTVDYHNLINIIFVHLQYSSKVTLHLHAYSMLQTQDVNTINSISDSHNVSASPAVNHSRRNSLFCVPSLARVVWLLD